MQQRIEALTNQLVPAPHEIAIKPIILKFYSRHLPQLSLVDLPGIVQVASADQPKVDDARVVVFPAPTLTRVACTGPSGPDQGDGEDVC